MMEPFLVYIIICVASAGGCNDYAPQKPWFFRSQKDCTIFAGKFYMAVVKDLEEKGQIVVDGKTFCLRFKETKET